MKKTILFAGLVAATLVFGGGCDIPWGTVATIVGASSTGDYSALISVATEWTAANEGDDDSDRWYCLPVCDWFD